MALRWTADQQKVVDMLQEVINSSTVLVDFYADWCGPCKMQSPIVDEVASLSDEYKVGKVNVDDEDEIAMRFKISSIPTLLVFKNGEVVKKFVGVTGKDTILAALK